MNPAVANPFQKEQSSLRNIATIFSVSSGFLRRVSRGAGRWPLRTAVAVQYGASAALLRFFRAPALPAANRRPRMPDSRIGKIAPEEPPTGLLPPWAAMLASTLALAALGRLAVPHEAPAAAGATPAAALAVASLGALCAVLVLVLDRVLLGPKQLAARVGVPDRALAGRYLLAAHLALWALAGVPAILGFAQLLLGGPLRLHYALCALSLGLFALLMPTRARIRARLDAVAAPGGEAT
jgi:hypothetical protein